MTEIEINKCDIISKIVSEFYNVDLKSKSRKKFIVLPKQIAQYFIKTKFNLPFQTIAEYFNYAGHDNSVYHTNKIKGFIEVDKKFSYEVDKIELLINNSLGFKEYKFNTGQLHYILEIQKLIEDKTFNELKQIHRKLSLNII